MPPLQPNPSSVPRPIELEDELSKSLTILLYILCIISITVYVVASYRFFRHLLLGDKKPTPPNLWDSASNDSGLYGTFKAQLQRKVPYQKQFTPTQSSNVAAENEARSWAMYGSQEREPLLLKMPCIVGYDPNRGKVMALERDAPDKLDQEAKYAICGRLSDKDLVATEKELERERRADFKRRNTLIRFGDLPVVDHGGRSLEERKGHWRPRTPFPARFCMKCGMNCKNCEVNAWGTVEGEERSLEERTGHPWARTSFPSRVCMKCGMDCENCEVDAWGTVEDEETTIWGVNYAEGAIEPEDGGTSTSNTRMEW